MEDREWLAGQFQALRPRLQSVAYSILGSISDAEDAVQECWLRLDRSDASAVADLARQREVVAAFLTAARAGNMRGLLEVLDPDVVFRADVGVAAAGTAFPVVGAAAVAERVLQTAPRFAPYATPAIVNGQAGAVFAPDGDLVGVIGFTVVNDLIAVIDLIADPAKLRHINRDGL